MKKTIHFIGIGGIGMSGLAQILHHKGAKISGSDIRESDITKSLHESGIKVTIGQKAANIKPKFEQIIYSPAILENNPELAKARKQSISCLTYPEALGELSKDYFTIAIAGTHGKSTTTAMTSLILENGGLDPTVVIGTKVKEFDNQNFRIGKSKYLVVEACEYKESFLSLHPQILIITNIEAEHLDYYKTGENYKKSFEKLCKQVKGTILTEKDLKTDLEIKPGVPGDFNITNATFAALVGQKLNIPNNKIEQAISNYKGSWRRMEIKKTKLKNTIFIDDYAHHPTEIKATLKAIREKYPKAKILCIFQPHQYNRTHQLLEEFGESFADADEVIVPNIYRVRDTDKDIAKVSPQDLVKKIRKNNTKAMYGESLEKTAKFIKQNHSKYDIIVTMGAGDITDIYSIYTQLPE